MRMMMSIMMMMMLVQFCSRAIPARLPLTRGRRMSNGSVGGRELRSVLPPSAAPSMLARRLVGKVTNTICNVVGDSAIMGEGSRFRL